MLALAGAYLIALWAVGVVVLVEAVFYVLVVWDDGKPQPETRHETIIDQYRRAR
jgi:hypothetical protein